ncbi:MULTISPECIES: CocE/NonD family hydrolase [unclassified Microbulbifer]|uniref:CocE/NonD family hydrolase n=1 Tax=unclassified Microbulbifer TaxID=2619833 RepID=UPI0027E41132|nr:MULTISPECIES: CocE/NonD family hydrolase [unclassified Microbulbifer]
MKIIDPLPRPIRDIEHASIPMSDGTRLAARIWMPENAEADPVPAILEYIPYRRRDNTRARDDIMHPWFAAHGYACVRVDIRGSGDSEGVLEDEYLQQELDDGVEILRWIARQPWCDGKVGMIGISWGGFNGLQIAALRPPELKAVVSVASTDDRYADDGAPRRRTGGCESSVQPCCTRDEGGPLGAAVQAEASNHLLLLHLKGVVVSEYGKGRSRTGQVRAVKSNASEPLMTCRKRRDDVKTGGKSLTRDKSGRNLSTAQAASGIKAARTRLRLLCGTWEPVTPMLRERCKWKPHEYLSTNAGYRGGATCSSEEGSVMELERRGCPIQPETRVQPAMGGHS